MPSKVFTLFCLFIYGNNHYNFISQPIPPRSSFTTPGKRSRHFVEFHYSFSYTFDCVMNDDMALKFFHLSFEMRFQSGDRLSTRQEKTFREAAATTCGKIEMFWSMPRMGYNNIPSSSSSNHHPPKNTPASHSPLLWYIMPLGHYQKISINRL